MDGRKEKLSEILGAENVLDDREAISDYSKDMSFDHPIKPACIVKPETMDEVQQIVKWANETLTPLIPVSSGPVRFRGDTVPSTGGAVIVDLSRMKRVIRVDRRNRVAMVEPGVTFGELQEELEKVGLKANMCLLPRDSKSVVASLLEREPVTMPRYHWDIADPLACTEVIFGTGDMFRTGSAAGPGTIEQQWDSGAAQKTGAGPAQTDWYRFLQGAQGTMGIVTWASLRCEAKPRVEEPFLSGFSDLNDLFEFVHWINRLRLVDECLVLNSRNLVTILDENGAGEHQGLAGELPQWILFFCITGYEYFPEERIAWQTDQMMDVAKRVGVKPVKALHGISAYRLSGILKRPCEGVYWKLRHKGSCFDVFFLATHDKIQGLIDVIHHSANQYGYPVQDMGIYLQPVVQGTGYHCEFNLFFDPDNTVESNRVKRLSNDIIPQLMNKGAFFSRPYGSWADLAYGRDHVTAMTLKKIKGILDPNNIMTPGKLCF